MAGDHIDNANQDHYRKFHNIALFEIEDTLRFDGPFPECQLEIPHLDTELVDDPNCSVKIADPTCEYEEEIVPDSEDEGIKYGSRSKCVATVLTSDKIGQRVKGNALNMKKRKLGTPSEQAQDIAVNLDASTKEQCDAGKEVSLTKVQSADPTKDSPQVFESDQESERLSYACSEEPNESSQANALDFVDNFLSFNDEYLSQGHNCRKTVKMKSPPLSRTKGPQKLAKRIMSKTPLEETRTFEWVDYDHQREKGDNFFCERAKTSFNFGGSRQIFVSKQPKAVQFENIEEIGLVTKLKGKEEFLDITSSSLDLCSKEIKGMVPESDMKIENKSVKELNAELTEHPSGVTADDFEIFDIGVNTQIAAEAMEALSYFPVNCSICETYQDRDDTRNDCSRSVTENETNIENSSPQKSILSDFGGLLTESNQTSQFSENLGRHSSYSSEKQYDNQDIDPEFTAETKAKRSKLIMESGIHVYRRRRSQFIANGFKVRSSTEKGSRLNFNLCGVVRNCGEVRNFQPNQQDQTGQRLGAMTSFRLDPWCHPRRRRTLQRFRSHSCLSNTQNAPRKRKREGKDDTKSKELLPLNTCPPPRALGNDRTMERTVFDPAGSDSILSSTTSTNVSHSNSARYEYHKKTFNKNLPKLSFLKEIAMVGVPESLADFRWKYLRRRRAMAFVRVLFSQHLDADIIHKQKKIVAQLGIPIASSSIDATHFIANKFSRTRNMLEAIALGKPVVTHFWLECCKQASSFIDEKNYILRDAKKEREIGFSMPISLARASKHSLLKGYRVLITQNIKPDKEIIFSLIKAVQGQPVERNQIWPAKEGKIPDDVLILSCEEDYDICLPFLKIGAAVYSSELLLNGIVIQELEYERHQLFKHHIKRNPSRKKLISTNEA